MTKPGEKPNCLKKSFIPQHEGLRVDRNIFLSTIFRDETRLEVLLAFILQHEGAKSRPKYFFSTIFHDETRLEALLAI